MSAALAKKHVAFKDVKQLLYVKNVQFNLFYPARLWVEFDKQLFIFPSPEIAQDFYDRWVATYKQPDRPEDRNGDE